MTERGVTSNIAPRGVNNPRCEFRNRRLRNSISILNYITGVDDNHTIDGVNEYILRQPTVHQILCVLEDVISINKYDHV